jgi:hypothetical protein
MAFCVLLIFGGDLNEMMRLFLFIQNLTDTLWCEGRRSLRPAGGLELMGGYASGSSQPLYSTVEESVPEGKATE